MEVEQPWVEWYLNRPGIAPEHCQAVLAEDALVSQVICCIQPVRLGTELFRCAIIDSVATDPNHRRQGLARTLMQRAHDSLRPESIDAVLLYTNPEGHPYSFYRRLGYRERGRASMLIGPRPGRSGHGPGPVDAVQHGVALSNLINRYHAHHEGFSPLSDELWRWHKVDPPSRPTVIAELAGSRVAATASFAPATLRVGGEERDVSVASDIAATEMTPECMKSLLSSAPTELVALLVDDRAPERAVLAELGLRSELAEVSMVLPFSEAAEQALEEHVAPWYVMVESVVGV